MAISPVIPLPIQTVPLYGFRCFDLFAEDEETVPVVWTKRGRVIVDIQYNYALKWATHDLRETKFSDRRRCAKIYVDASYRSKLPPPPPLPAEIPILEMIMMRMPSVS